MIELYADGACFPNPGNMAVGVVLKYGNHIKEFSEEIGEGTNNIAELTAIKFGLEKIKDRTIPVKVISDSQYALNVITGKWNPKSNHNLIHELGLLISEFSDINFRWERGHTGKNEHHERADYLANQFFTNGYDF